MRSDDSNDAIPQGVYVFESVGRPSLTGQWTVVAFSSLLYIVVRLLHIYSRGRCRPVVCLRLFTSVCVCM